jgi:hypothetical protein
VYRRIKAKKVPLLLFLTFFFALTLSATKGSAGQFPFLRDYYAVTYGWYYRAAFLSDPQEPSLAELNLPSAFTSAETEEYSLPYGMPLLKMGKMFEDEEITTDINLEGEISLNLKYGGDFSLKSGAVPGAGTAGITDGLEYRLIERIILEGNIGERFYVEFDYDSERTQEGIGEEQNIYSLVYRGRDDEFVKEISVGNKYLSIEGSRYIQIDEANQDSFGVRAIAGWDQLYMEGLFRYEVAYEGEKHFKGQRRSVDMRVADVDYAKGQFYFLPDKNITESSLLVYRYEFGAGSGDIVVDGKNFTLLGRGVDYDFDNTTGIIYLNDALELLDELIVYYTSGGNAVGSLPLGIQSIIDDTGARDDFDSGTYSLYFDATATYLYLKKQAFNSYWELKNIYYLDEIEGDTVYDVDIELLLTVNNGINGNYEDPVNYLDDYEIDASRGIISFNFEDGTGFYPRPFPGEDPFDPALVPYLATDPDNPFGTDNPIYSGLNYPLLSDSINTIRIQYSYSAESFFLDFNLVPGSVSVKVNGVTLDPAFYEVDHDFGIITFEEGAVGPSSDIVVRYKYNPFGEGDKSFFTAFGVTYENDLFKVRNLSALSTSALEQEAPQIGGEKERIFKNSTEFSTDFWTGENEEGLNASLTGGFAFSFTNENAYGSAIIADMEADEYAYEVNLNSNDWFLASDSWDLENTLVPAVSLDDRGSVLYKNYWRESAFFGSELQTLSWSIPSSNVFNYSEKAGPYNTADRPTGGNDRSLVIDYEFTTASTDPYATVVTSILPENLTEYEKFNVILKGDSIAGNNIQIYAEVLKDYNEDINNNGGIPDGESSINDAGFQITPTNGTQTVIGTDREGNSNGKIESEDLNGNQNLDTSEDGVVIYSSAVNDYIREITVGDDSWHYVSINIVDIINDSSSNRDVFQYVTAIRLTVKSSGDASGKVVINKLWFSGAAIRNNDKDILSISDVSIYEDSTVKANAFSKEYPGLYEELHGDSRYRARNEYVEKVMKVNLYASATNQLTDGSEATLSRRFGVPVNLTSYKKFRMFLFLPATETVPGNLDFELTILSSVDEQLDFTISGASIQQGWNEIDVNFNSSYSVELNGSYVGDMTKTGGLSVLKRVSEIQFSFVANGADVTQPLEIWLDEWFVSQSQGMFDKAMFAEGKVGYSGELLTIGSFPMVANPDLVVGYERLEGTFYDDLEFKSDKYYTDIGSDFFNYLDVQVSLSKENITPLRNIEELPNNLTTGGSVDNISHNLELDFRIDYVPVFHHSFYRTVTVNKDIELTDVEYRYKKVDGYNESLALGEYFDFPFGLSHSYSYTRNWLYENTQVGTSATSWVLGSQKSGSLNQVHDILFSYSWLSNMVSTNIKRDETFTGSHTRYYESWLSSYLGKFAYMFDQPNKTLEGAVLSTRTDSMGLDVSMPLENVLGFNLALYTDFTQSNFQTSSDERDTLVHNSLSMSFPFYPAGITEIEIEPGIEREITGDYREVSQTIGEADILLNSYKYIIMPPFYYINPIPGLGRVRDYDAVDMYKNSSNISGNTTNTFKTGYFVNSYLDYESWYIPSSVGVSISGETKREGANYTQKRAAGAYFDKFFPFDLESDFYDKSVSLFFDYEHERDYSTKVLTNTFILETGLNILKDEYNGIIAVHSLTYERKNQRINDERLYLFPDQPGKEIPVTEKPYSDKIDSSITFEYLWEFDIEDLNLFQGIEAAAEVKGPVQNTERIVLEDLYTFTDRDKFGSFSNIPFRATLEHVSSYLMSDNIEFGLNLKAMIGVEEKILPPSYEGDFLSSMGFEIGIITKILF